MVTPNSSFLDFELSQALFERPLGSFNQDNLHICVEGPPIIDFLGHPLILETHPLISQRSSTCARPTRHNSVIPQPFSLLSHPHAKSAVSAFISEI